MDWKRLQTDILRTLLPIIIGCAMLYAALPIAWLLKLPDLAPMLTMVGLSTAGVGFSHPLRRLLFPGLDMRQLAYYARNAPIGAGLSFLGMSIVLAALLVVIAPAARADELPPGARQHLPTLQAEAARWWPEGDVALMAAQVEQESCVSLKSPRCWSPRAELRTDREQGVGLGQITRTQRFDALTETRQRYPEALAGWAWDRASLYDPALQLRALVLTDRRNAGLITGTAGGTDHQAMMLVAYNGGLGRVTSDRARCRATAGCDATRWWGHVEHTSVLPRAAASGYGRSFFQITREYPRNIIQVRRPRYAAAIETRP